MRLQLRQLKWTRLWLLPFTTSVLLGLSGCGSTPVTVNNHTLSYLKEASPEDWVTVLHFLTEDQSHLSQSQWDEQSAGQICMPLSDWADINKMISDFCSAPHIKCDYKLPSGQTVKQTLSLFFVRLRTASGDLAFHPLD